MQMMFRFLIPHFPEETRHLVVYDWAEFWTKGVAWRFFFFSCIKNAGVSHSLGEIKK